MLQLEYPFLHYLILKSQLQMPTFPFCMPLSTVIEMALFKFNLKNLAVKYPNPIVITFSSKVASPTSFIAFPNMLKFAANTARKTIIKITVEAIRIGFSIRIANFVLNLRISIPIEIGIIVIPII